MDGKVFLRPLLETDAERMLEWMQNEDITYYLRIDSKSASMESVKLFIQNAQDESINVHRAISDSSGLYYGTISLKNIDLEKKEAEYAIALHPSATGTGMARAASEQIFRYAFENLGLKRVYLNVLRENARAFRFYNKMHDLGLKQYDVTAMDFNGAQKDLVWFEINRPESHCDITVSIIMPCYNVADTIARALDSILMQKVDFLYEIIIVDDASTDNSLSAYQEYTKKYPNIKLLQHKKNTGNARSFYDGLCVANGDYFCVLDGDDYYTIQDKLQRQVDFFRRDIKNEYAAVAHYHILDVGEGNVNLPNTSERDEFCYSDFLLQRSGYYHTATYLYRNMFRGNVPEYYKEIIYRGDTPRTTFHLMYSNKKVKILNFVGSAYTFLNYGIWSGMSQKKQFEYQINYLNEHYKRVTSDFERTAISRMIDHNKNKLGTSGDALQKHTRVTLDELLRKLQTLATQHFGKEADFTQKWKMYSEYIDSACASIGFMYLLQHPQWNENNCTDNQILILVDTLPSCECPQVYQIEKLARMYPESKLTLQITAMHDLPICVEKRLAAFTNLDIKFIPKECESKLSYLMQSYYEVSPRKVYSFSNNRDVYVQTVLRAGNCTNVCILLPGGGFFSGISNSNYDYYIAARPSDYWMLKNICGSRAVYNPYEKLPQIEEKCFYSPYRGHKKLRTATVSQDPYNVEGKPPYAYSQTIAAVLKATKGTHIHVGLLSKETLLQINACLQEEGLPSDAFVYIPEDNRDVCALLNAQGVDVVIASFPVMSYFDNLSLLAGGIPIVSFDGMMGSNRVDCMYDGALLWRNAEELVSLLCKLDKKTLMHHSTMGTEYYEQFCACAILEMMYKQEKGLDAARKIGTDDLFCDVRDHWRIFGNTATIKPMDIEPCQSMTAPVSKKSTAQSLQPTKPKATNENYEDEENAHLTAFQRFKRMCKKWDFFLYRKKESWIKKGMSPSFARLVLLLSPYSVYQKLRVLRYKLFSK